MLPLAQFKRFDVGPLLERGEEPLPAILHRLRALAPDAGLLVIAPFLPSPLIELLGSQGFHAKIERETDGRWRVYFWRAAS